MSESDTVLDKQEGRQAYRALGAQQRDRQRGTGLRWLFIDLWCISVQGGDKSMSCAHTLP